MDARDFDPRLRTIVQPGHARLRAVHRWIALAFCATVAAYLIAMIFGPPPVMVIYAPVLPMILLLLSGGWLLFRYYRTVISARTHTAGRSHHDERG